MFQAEIVDIAEENLVYIDESGVDNKLYKERGWSKRGEKIIAEVSGTKKQRISCISGTCKNKNIAPFIFEGNCNTEVFETCLEQVLAPELRPNQVVILDNVSFHKSQKAKDIIVSVGCKLMFLPPYSPDFNKQENVWANMKKFVRKTISKNNFNIISAVSLAFNSS